MDQVTDITGKYLPKTIGLLLNILSDEVTLHINTQKYHWNIAGEYYVELNSLFLNEYEELEKRIGLITERIEQLGGYPAGTTEDFVNFSRINESPDKYPSQDDMIKDLLGNHEQVIDELKKDIEEFKNSMEDAGTMALLKVIMHQHAATAGKVKRYLN